MNVIITNKLVKTKTKRNETINENFWFDVLNIDLLIWNKWFNVCVIFIFFYQTMFQRFKKMIIVKIIEISKIQKRKSTLIELIDSKKHKNRLLIVMSFKQTNWLINFEQENLQLNRFVDLKMFYVNFIQFTKTSCFVIFF